MRALLVALSLLFFARSAISAKILGIFPTPSISHQVVFHALAKDLAARGHELTVLTTDLIKVDNPNVTQIDLHDSYELFRKEFNFVDFKTTGVDEADLMDQFFPVMMKFVELQLNHPEVQKLIKEGTRRHFDVIIIEYLMYYAYLPFAEIYDCPVIGITSLDTFNKNHEQFGNGAHPVLNPEMLFSFVQGPLTFGERWKTLKYFLKFNLLLNKKYDRTQEQVIRKYFPNVTSDIGALKKRVNFLMTNAHPALGFIRPILPNTIQLGFMHIEPPKPLKDGDLKKFLDDSEHGVIYMSLGSNVQSKDLGPEVLSIFLKVFGSLKYDVVWKFESDSLPNKPKNVFIQKWLPQADLLAHPKIKLFITQGGQQSMEETIDRGVPTIVIPFLGDQDGNAKRMRERGFGAHLELHTMTEEKLRSTIIEMVKPIYRENVRKLRDLVYDQPMTSREKAVWWTEYVIRHKGAKHLTYTGLEIPFYQQYFLDFAAAAAAIVVLLFILLRKFLRKFRQESTVVKRKTN